MLFVSLFIRAFDVSHWHFGFKFQPEEQENQVFQVPEENPDWQGDSVQKPAHADAIAHLQHTQQRYFLERRTFL